jgi:hypothetical protein
MRTLVTFESDVFNTREPRDYFVNDACYGDDLAQALIAELESQGTACEPQPGQEDFGWYLTFEAAGRHQFVLSYRPETDDSGIWIGWVERDAGIVGTILGRRRKSVRSEATKNIHEALSALSSVRNIRWHTTEGFDSGRENEGARSPA